MIELQHGGLSFRFPEVHAGAACKLEFQRTLRIPDDNREYPLPPGFGRFPLFHVDDYSERVPRRWNEHGGVFMPMYQSEAMWINFYAGYPCAIKVAAGKICAVSGNDWSNTLHAHPQDYCVVPTQPWLDGFNVGENHIRQFVAMPLGAGYTAEEQITGKAEHGGVQIIVYPMKPDAYERWLQQQGGWDRTMMLGGDMVCLDADMDVGGAEMGLAPGGLMRQQIYDDDCGFDVWDRNTSSRCFVHIVNSEAFVGITGCHPPTEPPTAKQYTQAGFPWFDYYSHELKALEGAPNLAKLDSVAARRIKEAGSPLEGNEPVSPASVKQLGPGAVREGKF